MKGKGAPDTNYSSDRVQENELLAQVRQPKKPGRSADPWVRDE